MQRRRFISALAASTALVKPLASWGDSWRAQFSQATIEKPWLLAFKSVEQDALQATAETSGRLPDDLRGTLYRNGPARHEIGDFRYQHWFDGDGMLQAYRFTDAGLSHQGRMIHTRKFLAERDAGRALYPGFASIPANPKPVTSPDLVNVGNISVLHHHDKLLALWEAGSPWDMDPDTLETNGLYRFSENTEGMPFSAHPRVEPDGTLWNFGYVSAANLLVLWHIDANGKLVKTGTVPCDPMSMPHDFVVTSKHIVMLIPPLHFDPTEAGTFLDAHTWNPDLPTKVLVVDKNDFSAHQWLELPAQWVFHYGNAWEDAAGVIRFDGARAPDPLAMIETFREVMRGVTPEIDNPSHHHRYQIDTKAGTVVEAPMFSPRLDSEFPVIDPRISCRQNDRIIMMTAHQDHPTPHRMLNSVSVFDYRSGKLNTFRYPANVIPEEHLFLPKPGSRPETAGWVVGTSLNYTEARTELNVFDAQAVDAGPIYTAILPYALPLGLHGKFVAG